MSAEPTTVEKLRGLPWSIAGNTATTFFVQFTFFGSVFVLFLSALGLSKTEMGFLLSLLPFSGLVALFVAPAVARYGYKRTFLIFFSIRTLVTLFLLFTPWVIQLFGPQVTLIYVAVVVSIFAISRAIGLTASFPWVQEYVPNSVRGKYSATSNIFATLAGFVAVSVAGFVIGRTSGLTGFMLLIAAGVGFGLLSSLAFARVPGGAPAPEDPQHRAHRDLSEALRDGDFTRYLIGAGLITLATVPMTSFLPLYMQEQIGLSAANVVLLQAGTLLGGLLSSYVWGWAADRYGSKPVMLSGVSLSLLLPIAWLLMPRQSPWSLHAALAIALLQGVTNLGWAIGSARMLYVSVVPPDKKSDYMALYQAWIGIVGGVSQLIGGRVLDLFQGLQGQISVQILERQLAILPTNPYLPLFLSGLLLPLVSIFLLQSVKADSSFGVGEFVGMFFRGNPFMAVESLIRYHLAKDEQATVSMTERLGQAKSPLAVDELLEALGDPRFNVRFEAIISIARTQPDERTIHALVDVLGGSDPALSVIAAWALGRLGDERALEPLRDGLDARFRSIQAHSARALGTLDDEAMIPRLLERMAQEPDRGLRIAFASALGQMRAQSAITPILELLYTSQAESERMELSLAVARLVGDEHHFIQLLRHVRAETGTATSQAISALRKKIEGSGAHAPVPADLMRDCATALARDDLGQGITLLIRLVQQLQATHFDDTSRRVLQEAALRMGEFGTDRLEYILLTLHTMTVGWQP